MDAQSYIPSVMFYGVEIPTRCFVGGLPYSMTEMELNTFFSQFGTVKDSKIITDRNGVSKGYGFVTYESEHVAADVCAKGTLYYNQKKLNISKAIRRQGGQYTKANQEYVNGQRMIYIYQSPDGYLLTQKNGSWVMEDPSHFCQPVKPHFQMVSPPPLPAFANTAPYLQPPTYYSTAISSVMPASVSPYEPLPPPDHPGTPGLYCDLVEATAPPLLPLPPPPQKQHIVSRIQTLVSQESTLDTGSHGKEKEERQREEERDEYREEREKEVEYEEGREKEDEDEEGREKEDEDDEGREKEDEHGEETERDDEVKDDEVKEVAEVVVIETENEDDHSLTPSPSTSTCMTSVTTTPLSDDNDQGSVSEDTSLEETPEKGDKLGEEGKEEKGGTKNEREEEGLLPMQPQPIPITAAAAPTALRRRPANLPPPQTTPQAVYPHQNDI